MRQAHRRLAVTRLAALALLAALAPAGAHAQDDFAAEDELEYDEESSGDTLGRDNEPPGEAAADGWQQDAAASSERRPPVKEIEVPEHEPFYPEDEPRLEDKLLVERLLGIYLVHAPWRHVAERVQFNGSDLFVTYWYSIGAEQEAVACEALRWLASGRNQWAGGAAEIFDELADVQRVTLLFINVEKRKKGVVPGATDFTPYLQASITRDKVHDVLPAAIEEAVGSGKCLEYARRSLSKFAFDQAYYVRQQERGLDGN